MKALFFVLCVTTLACGPRVTASGEAIAYPRVWDEVEGQRCCQYEAATDIEEQCGEEAELVVDTLKLEDPYHCDVQRFHSDSGESLALVTVFYGEPMDCESGCIDREEHALVRDNRVTRVTYLDRVPPHPQNGSYSAYLHVIAWQEVEHLGLPHVARWVCRPNFAPSAHFIEMEPHVYGWLIELSAVGVCEGYASHGAKEPHVELNVSGLIQRLFGHELDISQIEARVIPFPPGLYQD